MRRGAMILTSNHHWIIVSINGESFRLNDKRKGGCSPPAKVTEHSRRSGEGVNRLARPFVLRILAGVFNLPIDD
jgi:hypothetical protein